MFGLRPPPWLNPTVIGAIAIAAISFGSGIWLESKFGASDISKAKLETAAVQSRYDGYRLGVMTNSAKATSDALNDRKRLGDQINALQDQLQQSQRKYDAKSKELLAILANAKPGDIRALGPTAIAYFDGLRGTKAGSTPAAPGNP